MFFRQSYLSLQDILATTNNDQKIAKMLEIYAELNIAELCAAEADEHTQKAIEELEQVKVNSVKKNQLKSFAINLLKRQN